MESLTNKPDTIFVSVCNMRRPFTVSMPKASSALEKGASQPTALQELNR